MKLDSLWLTSWATLALSVTGLSQGADLCANAQPIAGLGTFAFDNTLALTDGIPDPLCLSFGQDDIDLDVWYAWTSSSTGSIVVSTCNQTSVDTRIGIYDGSCSGTVLACNDDTCGLQSEVTFQALMGQIYMIRLGSFPGGLPGTGTVTVSDDAPVLNPANGFHYLVVDDPTVTWPQARIDAAAMIFNGTAGHLVTLNDQSENDFVFSLGNVHYHYIGGFQNTAAPNYSEPAGAWEWITGEAFTFTNWLVGEPNNTGPSGAEDYLELLQGGQFGATWNDTAADHVAGYVVEFETGAAGASGTPYCFGDATGANCPCSAFGGSGEGCANTTGTGAVLSGSGTPSISNDTFVLDVVGVPGAKPGLVLRGDNQVALPIGDGLLCTTGNSGRSQVQVTAGGATTYTNFAGNPFGMVANVGAPTNFQFWYRDTGNTCSGAGFNFTNAWTVDYQP